MSLYIVADENMPAVADAFGALGTVDLFPGRAFPPAAIRRADVLLVRSVTRVDAALLTGSRVRFVGSATIGTDHVDQDDLAARGVAFAHAPGCNADAVVEYVLAALLLLAVRQGEPLAGRTVGIVGCGNIGSRLARRLPALGLRVLQHDPPLAEAAEAAGQPHPFVSLDHLLAEADVVSLHVPLTHTGPYATHHLFDAPRLGRLKPGAWLLNTCRGPVVDHAALAEALRPGTGHPLRAAVLDVWAHEPTPLPILVERVALGTPHIAGHSYDGKVRGTIMLAQALRRHLGLPPDPAIEALLAPAPEDDLLRTPPEATLPATAWLHSLVRQMYDLAADDARMRALLALPIDARGPAFIALRKTYPRRRTFALHRLHTADVPAPLRRAVTQALQLQEAR